MKRIRIVLQPLEERANPTQAATSTVVTASPNPSNYGEAVTFSATVSPPSAYADIVYVSNVGTETIEAFDLATGGDLGAFASTDLHGTSGLAFDSSGNLYVANPDNNTIAKFTPSGVGSIFASTNLSSPAGIAFDGAGNMYVSNFSSNTITKIAPNGVSSVFADTDMSNPWGLAFDTAGNLYAANWGNGTITKFTPGGVGSVFASTELVQPIGLAFDSAGNLYAAFDNSNTIEKFTPAGTASVFANTGLSGPEGLAFGSAGNLYVVNDASNTIDMFTPGGVGSVFADTGMNQPQFIAIEPTSSPPSSPTGIVTFYDGSARLRRLHWSMASQLSRPLPLPPAATPSRPFIVEMTTFSVVFRR